MDIKQASFVMLILLISISGVYEWANSDETLGKHIQLGNISGLESSSLQKDVVDFKVVVDSVVATTVRLDLLGFISAMASLFKTNFGIFMKLLFGWTSLVDAIFSTTGLSNLSIIFISPVVVLQLLGLFYFLRDLTNTIRGVGGQ